GGHRAALNRNGGWFSVLWLERDCSVKQRGGKFDYDLAHYFGVSILRILFGKNIHKLLKARADFSPHDARSRMRGGKYFTRVVAPSVLYRRQRDVHFNRSIEHTSEHQSRF